MSSGKKSRDRPSRLLKTNTIHEPTRRKHEEDTKFKPFRAISWIVLLVLFRYAAMFSRLPAALFQPSQGCGLSVGELSSGSELAWPSNWAAWLSLVNVSRARCASCFRLARV